MNHGEVKNHLADYLEGDLSLDARALLDAHLDACPDCAQEVDQIRQTVRLLQALPEPEMPPQIAANVMRRVRAGETQLGFFERLGRLLGETLEPSFVLPASALAAAALVFVALQDPASLSRLSPLGFGSPTPSSPGAETNETRILSPEALVAGVEARETASPRADAVREGSAPRAATSVGSASPPSEWAERIGPSGRRLRIELEPIVPQAPVRLQEPIFAQRGPEPFAAGPAAGVPGTRRPQERWTSPAEGLALPVAQPRSVWSESPILGSQDAGAGDPRDQWIERGLADPARFARYIASRNLAEQELWVTRLTERAEARGLLEELVGRLQRSGDSVAAVIAGDFEAESLRLRTLVVDEFESEAVPSR